MPHNSNLQQSSEESKHRKHESVQLIQISDRSSICAFGTVDKKSCKINSPCVSKKNQSSKKVQMLQDQSKAVHDKLKKD